MAAISLSALLRALRATGLDIDAVGAMDAAWLSVRLAEREQVAIPERGGAGTQPTVGSSPGNQSDATPPPEPARPYPPTGRTSPGDSRPRPSGGRRDLPAAAAATVRLPVAAALPQSRLIARSLRPLRRRVPSATTDLVLDVERTVRRASEEGLWLPVFRPRAERWLDVAVVVDRSVSMLLWTDAVAELRRLLAWSGAFRSISTWWVQTDTARPLVFRRQRDVADEATARKPGKLTPVARRGLVLVVTDCVSPRWYDGSAIEQLREWSRGSLVAITHVLPPPFWPRTALSEATAVQLRTPGEGVTNKQLRWTADFAWMPDDEESEPIGVPQTFVAPVVPLEPSAVLQFARLVAGRGTDSVAGAFFDIASMRATGRAPVRREMDPKARVSRFFSVSSAAARRLAAALAASPVLSLRLLRLLRQELIPDGRRSHEAEVLLSGLVRVRGERQITDADDVPLEFVAGVRTHLLDNVTGSDALRVLRHAAQQAASSLPEAQTFLAALEKPAESEGAFQAESGDFMRLASEVLGRVGGAYGRMAVAAPEPAAEPQAPVEHPDTPPSADVPPSADMPVTPDVGHLSTPVEPFVNRLAEQAALWRWWTGDEGDHQPMFLTGPGGIGKTALAGQFVRRVLAEDPPAGGVLVLDEPHREELSRVYEYFVGPLDEALHEREMLARMGSLRRSRRLLVIDGGEFTAPEQRSFLVEFCAHFASSGQGRLLVVSRSQQTVYGAAVIDLGPLVEADVIQWMVRAGVPEDSARAFLTHAEGRPSEVVRILEGLKERLNDPAYQLRRVVGDATLTPIDRSTRLAELLRGGALSPDLGAEALVHLATAYMAAGQPEEAENALRDGRAAIERIGDGVRAAGLWRELGKAHESFGDTWGAIEVLQRALASFERLELQPAVADTLEALSRVLVLRGESDRALEIQRRRVDLLARIPNSRPRTVADAMFDVATLLDAAGRHEEAFDWQMRRVHLLEEAAAGAEGTGITIQDMAFAMTEAGRSAARVGHQEERQRYFQGALERWRMLDDRYMAALLEAHLAKPTTVDPFFSPIIESALSLRPGARVKIGSMRYADPVETHGDWLKSRGAHTLSVPFPFRLSAFLVTLDLYQVFVREGGYSTPAFWSEGVDPGRWIKPHEVRHWGAFDVSRGRSAHPVSGICFEEARAFVRWLNSVVSLTEGWSWSLPPEDAWEYVARGERGVVYPWGNEFTDTACNSRESGIQATTRVDQYPNGQSKYGAYDMAGNVWEFVEASDHQDDRCVLRGGSYLNSQHEVKSYLRLTNVPRTHRASDFGFRLAQVPPAITAS